MSSVRKEMARAISEGLRQCGDILAREKKLLWSDVVLGIGMNCVYVFALLLWYAESQLSIFMEAELTEGAIDE